MKAWFNAREPGERILILILTGVVSVALLYLLIWEPLSAGYNRQNTQLQEQKKLLAWMQQSSQEILQLQGVSGNQSIATGPLLSNVDRIVKSEGLAGYMKRLEPQGQDKVQLWFENAGFDKLVNWLATLQHQHAISVYTINIERQVEPGIVNARVVLQRGL